MTFYFSRKPACTVIFQGVSGSVHWGCVGNTVLGAHLCLVYVWCAFVCCVLKTDSAVKWDASCQKCLIQSRLGFCMFRNLSQLPSCLQLCSVVWPTVPVVLQTTYCGYLKTKQTKPQQNPNKNKTNKHIVILKNIYLWAQMDNFQEWVFPFRVDPEG